MRPQPKESNGVFGGGWERPSNVFMAARTFKRKMEATSNLNSKGKNKRKMHISNSSVIWSKKTNCDTLVLKSIVLYTVVVFYFKCPFFFSS